MADPFKVIVVSWCKGRLTKFFKPSGRPMKTAVPVFDTYTFGIGLFILKE
jgi:hypothetical protein